MAAQEFNCPKCGAPLDYQGTGATMRCPYCETSVVVPAELRAHAQETTPSRYTAPVQTTVISIGNPQAAVPPAARRSLGMLVTLIVMIAIVAASAMIAVPIILAARGAELAEDVIKEAKSFEIPKMALATDIPAPTRLPSPSPTPSFASLVTTFSSKGIGPGLLNDARYLAVDGAGIVYAADYQDGRIQAFDADGKYLHGWQVGDAKTIISGLAASHAGTVYVSYGGFIERFEGSSGKSLGKLDYEYGPEFGDMTVLPDGGLLAVWYEGRWGMITSLQGHRDDLVWFDAAGQAARRLESVISGQTGSLALDTLLAVDGLGNIYALSSYDSAVFKFTPQGKYVDRFAYHGEDPTKAMEGNCIAVDGQGRVYVGGWKQVAIFSPDGKFIKAFATENRVEKMAFGPQGDLYTLSRESVSRYKLGALP